MKRRAFIAGLGAATLAPRVLRAQQPGGGQRRLGVLVGLAADDPVWQGFVADFRRDLAELGWAEGRNLRVDVRFTGPDIEALRAAAKELVAESDVIFAASNPAVAVLLQETHTVPIVFASASDSVGSGFVASLAHPGGNVTGFHNFEPAIAGKWLELLKEIAPHLRRVALLYALDIPANLAFLRVAESVAPSLGLTVTAAGVRDGGDIERVLSSFAAEPDGGFAVAPAPLTAGERPRIIGLAERLKLPAIYPFSYFAADGGLIAYGIDRKALMRNAASYVDRILHGTKAGDLPVQLPTKFELAINLKTAKALGLAVPSGLIASADQVIE